MHCFNSVLSEHQTEKKLIQGNAPAELIKRYRMITKQNNNRIKGGGGGDNDKVTSLDPVINK